jgi:non-heme chloroperoxidase
MLGSLGFVIALSVISFAGPSGVQTPADRDASDHRVTFVAVEPGVNLELLDWGGSGPPLLLLAGLGGTAHGFDEFAHYFTDRFHVLGLTRRGFGASTRPPNGYDLGTLTHDILRVLDQAGFKRAALVGHSLGGDEMTTFAATYADRVSALVYLDAAYDRTQEPRTPLPPQPMTTDDRASIERVNAYMKRIYGWRLPEAELHATLDFGPDGRFMRAKSSGVVYSQIMQSLVRPAYDKVRAPALAIYAPPELRFMFPDYSSFDAERKAQAERIIAEWKEWSARSISQFRQEMAHGRVVVADSGGHAIFITNEAEVVRLTLAFLAEVVPK